MSKSSAPPKADNGTPPEPKVVQLRPTDDPPPDVGVELPCKTRPQEDMIDFLVRVGRHADVGIIPPDASLSARQKADCVAQWLEMAETDVVWGGTKSARILLAARETWQRTHPTVQSDLGSASGTARDLAGRPRKGPARAVAVLLERVAASPESATELSDAERELVRSLAPDLERAIVGFEESTAAGLQSIEEAAAKAQETFPGGDLWPAVVVTGQTEASS